MSDTAPEAPGRVAFVLGTVAGGTGAHAKMLVTGLAELGTAVSVAGPTSIDARFSFSGVPSVTFSAVEIGDRPRAGDLAVILRLRRILLRPARGEEDHLADGPDGDTSPGSGDAPRGAGDAPGGSSAHSAASPGGGDAGGPDGGGSQGERPARSSPARQAGLAPRCGFVHAHGVRAGALSLRPASDEQGVGSPRAGAGPSAGEPGGGLRGGCVVHAHGVRAGALTLLALALARRARRPRVVVTAHNAPPAGGGAAAGVYRLLERIVARGADLVLCVSPDLELRMRAAGARRVGRAVIAAPGAHLADSPTSHPYRPALRTQGGESPAAGAPDSGMDAETSAARRPVVLAAGRLAEQKGFGVLLEAAAAWHDLSPAPLVMIAGDGPLAGELRARAAALGVDAVFLGHRGDVPARLASAAVFVLPSLWEGQPLALQEALRAGTPVVATRVGGVPGLTGEDAALLVPPGDARALGTAVRSVLTDAAAAARLRAAAAARAATLPSETDAVTAALAAYAWAVSQPT